MFFKIMRTRKGFTLVELMIVVAILGILSAFAVPIFYSGYVDQAKKDCQNQRVIIETLVKEAMTGMLDNGKAQYKLEERENKDKREIGDYAYKAVESGEVWIDFSKVPAKNKTTYNGKDCFVLIYGDKNIDGNEWNGKGAFTLGDLRGGYMEGAESYKYAIYGKVQEKQQDFLKKPVAHGYYLKKSDMGPIPFYEFFAEQGSDESKIPVCPFAEKGKNYKYYIFEDGSVICSCPKCH